ncbi:MAG: pyridoxamine 5'-phosphate oxidase [Deltaproteobacteria bacterium]|nr:pyridoxamine 5'-phosphate oxidase [Deltaproteobacteria bacterium]
MGRAQLATFQLAKWALRGELPEANATALATVDASGNPSARMVLVKEVTEDGFVFYTSYASRKGTDLEANPKGALVFWWTWPPRQVRVEGVVHKVRPEVSDAYWRSRPRGSQLSAAASKQSAGLTDRSVLVAKVQELRARFEGTDVPRPPTWGGYELVPHAMEFWQGQADRLHERVRFTREHSGWRAESLQP